MPAPRDFRLTFVDVGKTKYGDCLLLQAGELTVLIDGAHRGDRVAHDGMESIPDQLRALLGRAAPWRVSLLVVTHCHDDHIGCLPELVKQGTLAADFALVADEQLGWGHIDDNSADPLVGLDDAARRLLSALREEPRADLRSDAQIAQFLEDAASLEDRYRDMLDRLSSAGTRVVRYGRDDPTELLAHCAPLGMKILGPSALQLATCAQSIQQDSLALVQRIEADTQDTGNEVADEVAHYRRLSALADAESDASRLGAAINNQSIVLQFEIAGNKLLLTGDMQFADAQVTGLDLEMSALRALVAAEAPFAFYKIAHHGSDNAFDGSVLAELGETVNFGMSGGWNDSGHPDGEVLSLLRQHREELLWLRTDKNGQFTFEGDQQELTFQHDKSVPNNTRKNVEDVLEPATPPPVLPPPPAPERQRGAPPVAAVAAVDQVQVTATVPHVRTKVTITIDVDPSVPATGDGGSQSPPAAAITVAPDRHLPQLLVVTDRQRLSQSVGADAANAVLAGFRRHPAIQVLDQLPSLDARECAQTVRSVLRAANDRVGVVLLGGYNVVPTEPFDALSPAVRAGLGGLQDLDDFYVFSDWGYGCVDDDLLPDLPVSRVLDGGSAATLIGAVTARWVPLRQRFGLRNIARPYADAVYTLLSGSRGMLTSRPTRDLDVVPAELGAAQSTYLMLHGHYADLGSFSGEDHGTYPRALALENIPSAMSGVVFTGCCWGALGGRQRAIDVLSGAQLQSVTAGDSLAARFLQAGVCGYVGCTGSHWSPTGKPLHDAFWSRIREGLPPAPALFAARRDFLSTFALAVSELPLKLKIYHQYTCLGLGW